MGTHAPHHSDALDAQLVLRAQNGDRHAFTELFHRHAQPAWRLATAVGGSADVAAPAVAKGYTLTLVRLQRRTTTLAVPFRHLVTRTSAEVAASASRNDSSPADPASNELAEAFLALPERWRAALWLTIVEGGTPSQIAPIVGLSEEGAASLVDRARAGLQARYARSTPLGAYFLRDDVAAKKRLRVLAVPMPATLEAASVHEWEAWQRTLTHERHHGIAAVVPMPQWAERVVSAAAVMVFTFGVAAALNHDTSSANRAPNVALPIELNNPTKTVTFTPASYVSGRAASLGRAASRGVAVGHASGAAKSATPPAVVPVTATTSETAVAIAEPAPPADTQGDSTPSAGGGVNVGDVPVAVTVSTDGAGVTVGDTTVGNTEPATPDSGVTVTADPGAGLPPIEIKVPLSL